MSQAGIVDVIGTHPEIPTMFVANVGTAVPIANTIELLGAAVAAHSVPLQTVASGNTVNFNVQYASQSASSVANKAGVASFDSTFFTVDANGYVTFNGSAATESFTVDASTPPGTNPVLPNGSGNITVTGGQVAAGTTTNVIRTDSLAANTYTIQIQRSQAVASSTVGDNGVSHFSSAAFAVDSNGFVTLLGGGQAVTSFIPNSGTSPVVPSASGQITLQGTGSITVVGGTNSLTPQLTGLTNHNVQVGAGTATLTQVAPSATAGIPLVSNGSSSDPSFTTALIVGGGTASTSFNINGAVYSNTTTTGALQAATLTSGQLLIGGTTTPAAANITAGTGVSIVNGNNSITINATGGGETWTDVTGTSQAMAVNNGYTANNAGLVTLTLPSTAAYGTIMEVCGKGAGGWTIAQNSGQTIHFGNVNTTTGTGGSLSSTNRYDVVKLLCTIANTDFTVLSSVGNITYV